MPGTTTTVPCWGLPGTLTVTSCPSPSRGADAGGTAHLHLPAWSHQPNHWPEDSAHVPWAAAHGYGPGGPVPPTTPSPLLPDPAIPVAPHLLFPHSALVPLTPTALPGALPSAGPRIHLPRRDSHPCAALAEPQGAPCPLGIVWLPLPWQHRLQLPGSSFHTYLLVVILISL